MLCLWPTRRHEHGFPQEGLDCFHFNQTGHKKADCPRLTGGAVMAPAPTTMRIIDGLLVKAEAHAMKNRTFQLTTEEALAAPDVVTGM